MYSVPPLFQFVYKTLFGQLTVVTTNLLRTCSFILWMTSSRHHWQTVSVAWYGCEIYIKSKIGSSLFVQKKPCILFIYTKNLTSGRKNTQFLLRFIKSKFSVKFHLAPILRPIKWRHQSPSRSEAPSKGLINLLKKALVVLVSYETSNSWHYSCSRSVYCRSIVFLLVV